MNACALKAELKKLFTGNPIGVRTPSLPPRLLSLSQRVWILRHVAMGYSVHLQRLLAIPTYWILPFVVPGYTALTSKGALLRGDALLMCE